MGLAGVQWREKMQAAIIEQQFKKMLKKKKEYNQAVESNPFG